MKRMIDTEKFLDKLLYMGYMDEEKSEIEEVANRMTEDAYTQDEVIAMFTELQNEIEELKNEPACCQHFVRGVRRSSEVIQQKIEQLKGKEDIQDETLKLIDKIRKEHNYGMDAVYGGYVIDGINAVLELIDNHISRSEVKDDNK